MAFRLKQFGLVLAILLLSATPLSHARTVDRRVYGPLPTRTQNPILLQFLGLALESPQTLNRHEFASELQTTFSNLYEVSLIGNTRMTLDMELWRTVFVQEYGVTDNLDVRFELPFLTNSGGFIDSFVQSYHRFFGFPNGGRNRTANDQYRFTLSQGGRTLFDHAASPFGLSDLTLRAKWMIPKTLLNPPFKLAVAPSVKIPTGRVTKGLSSGRFDFGLGVLAEKAFGRFHLVSQAGLVILGGHETIGALVNRAFVQFGQSVEFQIMDGWSAVLQLTGNTAAFKNIDAKALKGPAVDFTTGFAGSFPLRRGFFDEFYYKFSFSEDITSTGPSVDFSTLFAAGLRY
jgi:hypothetical protein